MKVGTMSTFSGILYYAALISFFICDAFIFTYLRVCLISYFILSYLVLCTVDHLQTFLCAHLGNTFFVRLPWMCKKKKNAPSTSLSVQYVETFMSAICSCAFLILWFSRLDVTPWPSPMAARERQRQSSGAMADKATVGESQLQRIIRDLHGTPALCAWMCLNRPAAGSCCWRGVIKRSREESQKAFLLC